MSAFAARSASKISALPCVIATIKGVEPSAYSSLGHGNNDRNRVFHENRQTWTFPVFFFYFFFWFWSIVSEGVAKASLTFRKPLTLTPNASNSFTFSVFADSIALNSALPGFSAVDAAFFVGFSIYKTLDYTTKRRRSTGRLAETKVVAKKRLKIYNG